MTIKLNKGRLKVKISDNRTEMGKLAAEEVADYINDLLKKKPEINIIFASAPSQNDFLVSLLSKDIEWNRINAFHMDEYLGIDPAMPQSFGKFLKDRVFSKIECKSVNYINPQAPDREKECLRYAEILRKNPPDIIFLGIGENGHLAFNDPHVAFFDDPLSVKVVDLDMKCRKQQVNDGCFSSLEEVPTHAYTLTIPELLNANKLVVIVPTRAKAEAVKNTCDGRISTECPASILRTHKDVTLYLDEESASLINGYAKK